MAVAIAVATLRSFITLGLPLLRNAVGKDLQDDVESISTHLDYIRASFLDHFGSAVAPTSKVEDQWLKDMNLLSYAMEDLIDCFITKTPLDMVGSEAAGFFSPAWRFAKRMVKPRSIQIRKKIRQLEKRSKEARERFDGFGMKQRSEDAPTASTEDESATHVTKEYELLQHLLRTPSESEKKLMVISIVGYGALGNTLLVDNVYNTNQVQNRFSRRTRYNAAGKEAGLVIKEIRAQVTQNQNGGSTSNMGNPAVEDLKEKAVVKDHKYETTPVKDLKGKAVVEHQEEMEGTSLTVYPGSSQKDGRYLLVIDNVGMDKLRAIINNFDDVEGGIIIVVTTDYTEAIHCKCTPLDLDRGDDKKYMKINDLTGTICKEEAVFREETGTHKQKLQELLVHNYNKSLSSLYLEHCLLYFCMFPRHHLVRWNLLIRRYLAEGIDVGELRRSLEIFIDHHAVQVRENGEVKRCQFPVMMLNHISDESNSNNFLTSSCGSTDTPTSGLGNPVRRLSLHQIIGENDTLTLPDASVHRHLRTLAVFHTGSMIKCPVFLSSANISKLSRYKLLRVLDMKECPVFLTKNQLKKICNLLLLKYLGLGDSVDQVPREIAKLQLLQTLAMTKTKTVCVPVEVMELPELKHLLGKFQLYKRDITKKKLKQLLKTPSQLQSLSGFVVHDSKEFEQLMSRMKKLSKVKIWCDAGKLTDNVTNAINKFTEEVLSGTRSLSIECNEYPSEIVKCLEHHGFLTSLKLCGGLKTHLDVQVDRPIIGLQGIKVLCLSGTDLSGEEIIRLVTLFRSLEYLKMVEDNLGEVKIPAGCLYTLRRLCLVAASNLDRIIISEDSVLRSLVSLHMLVNTQCDLSRIDIDKLKKLEEITLYSDVADKRGWQDKASRHEKSPKVLFTQRPNSSDEPSCSVSVVP